MVTPTVYVRQPDALDYSVIGAVTALTYLQWDGRHELHAWLLGAATGLGGFLRTAVDVVTAIAPQHLLLGVLVLGVGFLVAIVEVVPRLTDGDAPDPGPRRGDF